jgi:hypothetical protein
MGTKTQFWEDVPTDELKKMETSFSESVPLKRLGTVEEVASAYIQLMTKAPSPARCWPSTAA